MDTLCKALIFVPLFGGLAACSESPAPSTAPARSATAGQGGVSAYPTVALGSGTGTARDLRNAADFASDGDIVLDTGRHPGGDAFGVGIRPGHSASGIRP